MEDDSDAIGFPKIRGLQTKQDLRRMAPQMRSKYLAYQKPTGGASGAIRRAQQRVRQEQKDHMPAISEADAIAEEEEKERQSRLIGQLKASEARNRLRIMRMRFQSNRRAEVEHLISCQPTALDAVRLEAILPSAGARREPRDSGELMNKRERRRTEALVADSQGLLTDRIG